MVTANIKLQTIEQYKVLEYLTNNLDLPRFRITLIDRTTIQVTDKDGAVALFNYNKRNDKIEVKYL